MSTTADEPAHEADTDPPSTDTPLSEREPISPVTARRFVLLAVLTVAVGGSFAVRQQAVERRQSEIEVDAESVLPESGSLPALALSSVASPGDGATTAEESAEEPEPTLPTLMSADGVALVPDDAASSVDLTALPADDRVESDAVDDRVEQNGQELAAIAIDPASASDERPSNADSAESAPVALRDSRATVLFGGPVRLVLDAPVGQVHLESGFRFDEGDLLPSGARLMKVERERIVILTEDGEELEIGIF